LWVWISNQKMPRLDIKNAVCVKWTIFCYAYTHYLVYAGGVSISVGLVFFIEALLGNRPRTLQIKVSNRNASKGPKCSSISQTGQNSFQAPEPRICLIEKNYQFLQKSYKKLLNIQQKINRALETPRKKNSRIIKALVSWHHQA